MKGAIIVTFIFFASVLAGCLEDGENELYKSTMESFEAPDTRFITNPDRSVTYDFGNQRIIAQSNALFGIDKLWIANVSDPLLDRTRAELRDGDGFMTPSASFSRSNILALYYSNPRVTAVTCCSNQSGLVQAVIPQMREPIEMKLSVYGEGEVSEQEGCLKIGKLCVTSNIPWAGYSSFDNGADVHFEFDEPLFIEFSDNSSDPLESFKAAFDRADWIDERFSAESSLYETMFSSTLDCALSSYKVSNGTKGKNILQGLLLDLPDPPALRSGDRERSGADSLQRCS